MAFVILDNAFTNDLYQVRTARLQFLKAYIDTHAPALSLPPDLLTWAQGAYDVWYPELIGADMEWAEKESAFLAAELAEKPVRERLNILKDLLRARYVDEPIRLERYNIDEDTPRSRKGMVQMADDVLKAHGLLKAEGDPHVLPDEMMDNLLSLLAVVNDAETVSRGELADAKTATKKLKELFDNDSKKLGLLHNWAVAMWGADDPRMLELGFVQRYPKTGGGGEVPSVPEGFAFEWLDPAIRFEWSPVEGATSYQLAMSEDGESWEEIFSGPENALDYEPGAGLRYYRVRARNANGYGDWSETLEHEVEGGEPPVGVWPTELAGLYAEFRTLPAIMISVGFDLQAGADSYNLKRAKVHTGDPDPTDASMPEDNYVEELPSGPYADTDVSEGDKCAYWACGVQGGVEGNWTGPVIAEYAE